MGVLIYTLVLMFFIIPVSLRAYLSLGKGRFPLSVLQNNIVVNRIKLRKSFGIISPIAFWSFHVFFIIYAVAIEAWLSALAVIVYMVVSSLLSGQIKAKQVEIIQEGAVPKVNESKIP